MADGQQQYLRALQSCSHALWGPVVLMNQPGGQKNSLHLHFTASTFLQDPEWKLWAAPTLTAPNNVEMF